jgi:cell shape-determining protein MreD
VQASLAPLLATGDLRPNLILAAVVAVTLAFGLGPGATWAFVGGLTANLLTTDPLGTIPLGLLAVAGLTTLAARGLGRANLPLALVAGALGSLVLDVASFAGVLLQGGAGVPPDLRGIVLAVLPTAILNGALAGGLFILARAVSSRFGREPSLV